METQVLLEAARRGSLGWLRHRPERPFFGYLCSYWPEELTLSLGWEPLRLLPPGSPRTSSRLPSYTCAVGRGCLALGEAGEFSDLAGVGFAHTCDTMRCLAGIWRSGLDREKTFVVVPPANLLDPGAQAYFAAELASLWRNLARLADREPDPEALRRAIGLMNRIRSLAGKLDAQRARLPSDLAAAVLRAGQLMPRAAYAEALEQVIAKLDDAAPEDAPEQPGRAGKLRVLLSGAVLETEALHATLEELGARVVADDTCTGFRHYAGLVDEDGEPLAALARRYLSRPPCPCRHQGLQARLAHLLGLAGSRGARGAVLAVRKYCEPHAWDAVALRESLRAEGIPTLVLELDSVVPGEQERTRLQAFLESLD